MSTWFWQLTQSTLTPVSSTGQALALSHDGRGVTHLSILLSYSNGNGTRLLNMDNEKDKFAPLGGAYSHRIIGAVVKAFNLEQGVLTGRTAKRFCAGKPVSEHSQNEILEELARALIERCIPPIPPQFHEHDLSMVTVVSGAIALAAARWDYLLATIQSRSGRIIDRRLAAERFLRLVIVDLSVRVFALMRLSGLEPSRPETPSWAEENGGGQLLRQLTKRAGLTRDQLAARLRMSDTSVDNWLDGKHRPDPENIRALANELAGQNTDIQRLERQIRRQFTYAQITDLLAPWIGREKIIDLSTALTRFVWAITEDVRQMKRPSIDEDADAELIALVLGSTHPITHVLLKNLALVENDANWKKDILAATDDWSVAFEMVALQAAQPRTAAGLAQDLLDVSPKEPTPKNPDAGVESMDSDREALRQLLTKDAERTYRQVAEGDFVSPLRLLEAGIATRAESSPGLSSKPGSTLPTRIPIGYGGEAHAAAGPC